MRAREFLLEYDRAKTASMVGDKLVTAFANDRTRPAYLASTHGKAKMGPSWYTPELIKEITDTVLAAIEDKDPTPNKIYTAWLARMYAAGKVTLAQMNRGNLLGIHEIAKKRRMLSPEHKDINNFKTYNEFEDTMLHSYNTDDIQAVPVKLPKGKAEIVKQFGSATIIIPQDEAASQYYGQGTGWCTAYTNRPSHFNSYNSEGPLYIIIPKHAEYPGEKYQLHFPKYEFKDEKNHDVKLNYIINDRFPDLLPFFQKVDPALKYDVRYADTKTIQRLLSDIKEIGEQYIDTILDTEKGKKYLANGDIDVLKRVLSFKPDVIRRYLDSEMTDNTAPFTEYPDIPWIIRAVTLGDDRHKSDFVNDFLLNVSDRIKKQGDDWVIAR